MKVISDAFDNDKGKSHSKLPYGWINHHSLRDEQDINEDILNSRRREEFFNYVAKLCMSLIYLIKKYNIMLYTFCNYVIHSSRLTLMVI